MSLTSRRTRTVRRSSLVALAALSALALGACGGAEVAAEMTSSPRPERPRSELAPPQDPAPGGDELPDVDIPDELGDLGDQLDDLTDGLGAAGDCASIGFDYASLLIVPFTSDDPTSEIDDVVEELRDKLPSELQDDLDLVADTLTEAADQGISGAAGTMTDPAFTEAYQAIAEWIGTECV